MFSFYNGKGMQGGCLLHTRLNNDLQRVMPHLNSGMRGFILDGIEKGNFELTRR
jgi:hypothetical protein